MTELSAPLVDIGDIAYSLQHGDGNKNSTSPAPATEASGRAKLIANILAVVLFSVYSAVYPPGPFQPPPAPTNGQTSATDPFMPCDCTYLGGTSGDHNGQCYGVALGYRWPSAQATPSSTLGSS